VFASSCTLPHGPARASGARARATQRQDTLAAARRLRYSARVKRTGTPLSRFLSLGLLLWAAAGCAHGRSKFSLAAAERGIAVTGAGTASAPPNIARSSLGVETRAADVTAAMSDATMRMTAVTQAIKQLGIADQDLRTHSFSIGFEPAEPAPPPAPIERNAASASGPRGFYRVSNMLEVTIRDLQAIGRVLSAATAAGANNVWGINFEVENTEPLKTQARAQAVRRAQAAAAELAQLTGAKLGKLLAVSEAEGEARPGGPMLMSMRAAANADVPIERGEITVHYSVRVLYDVREKDDH